MSGSLTWNSGTISSIGEIDYYSIFLTAGTFCDFYLQEEALYNGNIELQSSPGTAVAGQYSSSDLVTHTPSSSGTYYIEVSGSNSSYTGSYSVTTAIQGSIGSTVTATQVNSSGDADIDTLGQDGGYDKWGGELA